MPMDLSPTNNNALDANAERRRLLRLSFQQQQAADAAAMKEPPKPAALVPDKTK